MNNSDNIFAQKRILIAIALSFIFFIFYDYFFIPKNNKLKENNTTIEAKYTNQAPSKEIENKNISNTNQIIKDKIISTIESEHFKAQIDSLGRISSFYLKDKKFQNENKEPINLISKTLAPLPLEIRFIDTNTNNKAFNTDYIASKNVIFIDENSSSELVLTQTMDDLKVEKTIKFYPKGNYEINVRLSKSTPYFISSGYRPNVAVDSYTIHGVLLLDTKDTIQTFEDGDMKNDESFNNINIASAFDRYYASFFYNFDKALNITLTKDKDDNPLIFAYSENEFNAGGYIGAKEYSILNSIDPRLKAVIEYGWFTFIAKPMFSFLNYLHQYLQNWGWAIVVLTLIIRILLFPLTYKSMISMNKLKELAPKLKEIKEKCKGNPQKMNVQMMELYKKHGANPMSGCLPILLQIPIFFAIYRVLLNAIELKAAPWAFWIHDLSVMDPYFVLPIFMGITMFLQQLITPMTIQDPMQAKIMKFLPLIFTFFFLTFPAGLTLYWCVNNICSLIQQWVINKIFEKENKKGALK